ncbi:MAG: hypothetical protein ACLFR0_05465 [Alphaproteobacteria bacterium]
MKQIRVALLFTAALLLLVSSIALIFIDTPRDKSLYYQSRSAEILQDLSNSDLVNPALLQEGEEQQQILQMRKNLLHALMYEPYNPLLWARFTHIQKILDGPSSKQSEAYRDAYRISQMLGAQKRILNHDEQ